MKTGVIYSATSITKHLIKEMVSDIYNIKSASNFDDLQNLLKNEQPDFLIIDRTLKDMSAKDIFIKLIENGIGDIPPSVLLTQDKYDPLADGEGYNIVLKKPFVQQEILESINFALTSAIKKKLKNILIVDDSKTSRTIIKSILTKYNYNCIEAENATEGIKKAELHKPELIIVDYLMPDFTGIEFAKKISENITLRDIPVILITGSGNFSDIVEKGFNSGISAYFQKPFQEDEILNFFYSYFHSDFSSKILVLDDSYTRRKVIYSNLTINNYMVITTDTINRAVSYLENNHFELILVDLILKNETGFDAIKAFRKINEKIPIIVYSSIADRRNVYKILEIGANDYLWSPIEMRELILKVKIWLEYSKLLNFKESINKNNLFPDNSINFKEYIHNCMHIDNINGQISSLVFIDNIDKKILREIIDSYITDNNKLKLYDKKAYIYFQNRTLLATIKQCKKLKLELGEDTVFGISSTDSVKTVEELFEKAENNILKI